jgi:hypothetical protein
LTERWSATSNCSAFKANLSQLALSREGCHRQFSDFEIEVPATKKGRCRLHGGASGSGGPTGERNGQCRHGERTKAAIGERQKFSALLKMLRAGLT